MGYSLWARSLCTAQTWGLLETYLDPPLVLRTELQVKSSCRDAELPNPMSVVDGSDYYNLGSPCLHRTSCSGEANVPGNP